MSEMYAGSNITALYLNAIAPQTGIVSSAQTIISTSPAAISGLTATLEAGYTYTVRAWIVIETAGGTSQAACFQFTGPPSPSLYQLTLECLENGVANNSMANLSVGSAGYNSGTILTQALSSSASITYTVNLTMLLTTTAAGSLTLGAGLGTSNSDEQYSVLPGSYMQVQQA